MLWLSILWLRKDLKSHHTYKGGGRRLPIVDLYWKIMILRAFWQDRRWWLPCSCSNCHWVEVQCISSQVCSLSDVEDGPREIQSDTLQLHHSGVHLRSTVPSLETSSWWKEVKLKGPLPFQGLFTSQLQCTSCKCKVLDPCCCLTFAPYVKIFMFSN